MSEVRKWVVTVAAAILAVFVLSFIAGQCREWRKPKPQKPPKPIPGYVDPGTPAPGPVSEAPTVGVKLPIAVPKLTRAELEAEAAKLGFKLTPRVGSSASGGGQGSRSAPEAGEDTPDGGDRPAEGNLSGFAQTLLAKERFGPGPAGDHATVWAWQMEEGGRVQLFAEWDAYQPPPVEPAKVSYFGNTAKWEKFIMLGYVGQVLRHDDGTTETKADPGIGLGLAFHSWRIGKANIDARAIALVTPNGGAAIGGAGLSW